MFLSTMKYEILALFITAVACRIVEAAPTLEGIKDPKLFDVWSLPIQSDSARRPREEGERRKRQSSDISELSSQLIVRDHLKHSAIKNSRKSRATTMTFAFEIDDFLAYFLGESWKSKKKD